MLTHPAVLVQFLAENSQVTKKRETADTMKRWTLKKYFDFFDLTLCIAAIYLVFEYSINSSTYKKSP